MAKAKAKDKAVAKKGTTDVAVHDYGEYADGGFENQTKDDLTIPFLAILQGLSPQVKPVAQGGMDGAKVGMIFNTVTEDLIDGEKGVYFVPAYTQHTWVEWVPRKKGGGFVATFAPDSPEVAEAKANAEEFGDYHTPDGNDLVETFYVYGVECGASPDDPVSPIVIAYTSTKIKAYKRWNTKLSMFTVKTADGRKVRPPMFAHLTRVLSVPDSNTKGDFYNISMVPANFNLKDSLLATDDPRFQAALDCKSMVERGDARASYETQNADGGDAAAAGGDDPF